MKKFPLYDNGIWRISETRAANKIPVLFVENLKTGFCDWPIQYTDGRIAYDFPERIPEYIHRSVKSMLRIKSNSIYCRLDDCRDLI